MNVLVFTYSPFTNGFILITCTNVNTYIHFTCQLYRLLSVKALRQFSIYLLPGSWLYRLHLFIFCSLSIFFLVVVQWENSTSFHFIIVTINEKKTKVFTFYAVLWERKEKLSLELLLSSITVVARFSGFSSLFRETCCGVRYPKAIRKFYMTLAVWVCFDGFWCLWDMPHIEP